MTQANPARDPSTRSPFAGCAILITALGVMLFLIIFSVVTLFRQFNEIAKFTDSTPASIEISSLENQEPKLLALAQRVEGFRQALAGEGEAFLELSAEEMNLAIAAYDSFKELRNTLRVTGIDENSLQLAISFPLNGKPRFTHSDEKGWIASDSRFLNGTMIARPTLLKHEIVLKIDKIDVPAKKVAPEFIDQMSPYRVTERYLTDPVFGPAMAKLTEITFVDGKLRLTRRPGQVPVDLITNSQVDSASGRLFTTLGIAAVVFLAFAGLITFLGVRKKARNLV
jgi:hypothetical protein